MKKTVIFDLGGVLIDWNPRYLYRKVFSDEEEMEYFLTQICTHAWNAQMDLDKTFKIASDELKSIYPDYSDQIQIWNDRWEEMFSGSIVGSVNILKELKDLGYPLAALSNWSAEMFPITFNRFDFLSWFDPLIISGEVGLVKPDPAIFYTLLRKINRNPKDCVFIDDTLENIEVARDLGFVSIHFITPEDLRPQLEKLQILKDGKI